MEIYNIENKLELIQNRPTHQDIERIDKVITRILNVARKKVERMKRSILFSIEKEKRRAALLFWKRITNSLLGKRIDEGVLEK